MNLVHFKTRILNVSVSTNDKSKRQSNRIITTTSQRNTASPIPGPSDFDTHGNADSAASPTPPANDLASKASEIQSRTVALLNIPDTVNDARIRALAQPYGEIIKISLRPNHQGAIIEYRDAASVGRASLALEGHEIAPGRTIGTGTVNEMNKQKPEYRGDKISGGAPKKTGASLQPSAPIRRPHQPGARRGGRGGLGVKRGGVVLGGPRASDGGEHKDVEMDGNGEEEKGKAKSNADFKAMFLNKTQE